MTIPTRVKASAGAAIALLLAFTAGRHSPPESQRTGVVPVVTSAAASPTSEQVAALADALWQLLDDMGLDGQSVCLAAKAQARVAFEPFMESDTPMDMTLDAAKQILAHEGESLSASRHGGPSPNREEVMPSDPGQINRREGIRETPPGPAPDTLGRADDGWQLVRKIITAWESLPEGRHTSEAIQRWLKAVLGPTIHTARKALAAALSCPPHQQHDVTHIQASPPAQLGAYRSGLRDLAKRIGDLTEEHFNGAQVSDAVHVLQDHLCARARSEEINQQNLEGQVATLTQALAEADKLIEQSADDFERITDHALDTPGLHYDTLEQLIGSATGIAKTGRERARAFLDRNKVEGEKG